MFRRNRLIVSCVISLCAGMFSFAEEAIAAECPGLPGYELISEDDKNWYCLPVAAVAIYNRLSRSIGFTDISSYQSKTPPWLSLGANASKHLRYFASFVIPRTGLAADDAILVLWWAYIEGILWKSTGPWGFLNCRDPITPGGGIDDTTGIDCRSFRSGGWQVGYGVQVFDQIGLLRTAFQKTHSSSLPKEVADRVLIASGIQKLEYPPLLGWNILTQKARVEDVLGSGRSNHFWASILMRDPLVSAVLEAPVIATTFNCYMPSPSSWCRQGYTARRELDSQRLLSLLKGLEDAGYFK